MPPVDKTTIGLYTTRAQQYNMLAMQLGSEVVEIVCKFSSPVSKNSNCVLPSNFTVHKNLLCRHSRYFEEMLGRPMELEAVVDALLLVEEDPGRYLFGRDAPPGYISSDEAFFRDYQRATRESSLQVVIDEKKSEVAPIVLDEDPHVFATFVDWLYTQNLFIKDDFRLIELYNLAEHIDAPDLLSQCYQKLCDVIEESECLHIAVAKCLIKNCSPTSTLYKFFAKYIAVCLIEDESGSYERILNINKVFETQVAKEAMKQLRGRNAHNNSEHDHMCAFADYESDLDSSIDTVLDSENDSDEFMSESGSADQDSMMGDNSEDYKTDAEQSHEGNEPDSSQSKISKKAISGSQARSSTVLNGHAKVATVETEVPSSTLGDNNNKLAHKCSLEDIAHDGGARLRPRRRSLDYWMLNFTSYPLQHGSDLDEENW